MRNLQLTTPSSSPLIPGTPNPPTHSSAASTSSLPPPPPQSNIQASVEHLQAQNAALHCSLDSFQTQMQSQFSSFQQSVLDAIVRLQPPSSTPTNFHLLQSTLPQLSFGSIQPNSTTWTGLGLSNPPSPTIQSVSTPSHTQTHMSQHHHRTPIYSTTATYSTIPSVSGPSYTLPDPHNSHSYPSFQGSYNDPFFYKPPKVDLPRFNGDDVVGWLAMAERYIRVQRIPPHERVSTIASHFGPDASVWMNSLEQRQPNISWERFVPAFLEHFGSSNNSDFKALLSHLQHTTTVEAYISAFTKLSCRAPEWSDEQLLPIFCGGLKPEMNPRNSVRQHFGPVMDCTMVLAISDGKIVEYDEPMKLMKREDSLFGQLVKEYWSHLQSAESH